MVGIEQKQLKIGEVSKRSGVGIEALRFYEKNGLIDRPGRTHSGYRVFDESVLDRIAFIKQAQTLGFALSEIAQLIRHKNDGESPCEEVRHLVRKRLRDMDERIDQMIQYRAKLTAELKEWDKIGHADGHVCGLIESSNIDSRINGNKSLAPKGRAK